MQEKSVERQEQVLFFSMSDRKGKGEEGGGQLIVGTEMELIGALEEGRVDLGSDEVMGGAEVECGER